MPVTAMFHFEDESQKALPETPAESRSHQPRVLLVEPLHEVSRPLLGELCNAGIDCRLAVEGSVALQAARETQPQLIVFDDVPSPAAYEAVTALKQATSIPIVVLCRDHTAQTQWIVHAPRDVQYLVTTGGMAALVQNIERHLARACGGNALFVTESTAHRAAPPVGWGVCRDCGYMGPRGKFASSGSLDSHSLRCPACRHSANIEFTIA